VGELSAFRSFYRRATREERGPYSYQERLATAPQLPAVLDAPTGSGKTRAVLLAWLYRRLHADPPTRTATPLRLVYALPMRVLVEQVWQDVRAILDRLGLRDGRVGRHLLMGGHADRDPDHDWVGHPERPAVLVGTVDMLLSRALNRGYAVGRSRWPMEFGLLNSDCLWVLDETQLMDVAAVTAAQLDGLRDRLGTWRRCHTIWMSATVDRRLLSTVDHPEVGPVFSLEAGDLEGELGRRLRARKVLERRAGDVAAAVMAEHAPGTVTLVVHNTVKSAVDTHRTPSRHWPAGGPELVLLHSRFRPPDRARRAALLTEPAPPGGRVVCATQVVEAGVDISARLLVTEVAPWSSIVQRLGRCNRYGELEAGRSGAGRHRRELRWWSGAWRARRCRCSPRPRKWRRRCAGTSTSRRPRRPGRCTCWCTPPIVAGGPPGWTERGLGRREVELASALGRFTAPGVSSEQTPLLLAQGRGRDLARPVFGPGSVWRSLTPFLPMVAIDLHGSHRATSLEQVLRDALPALRDPVEVRSTEGLVRWIEFRRGGPLGVEVSFAGPVEGPWVASHQPPGLGLFLCADQ
jgi:DEAD/DEAH box helicase